MSIELVMSIVAGVVVIVFAHTLSSRVGVAGPLILLAVGVCVSLIPAVPAVSVPPELILAGVLPPLLFSAAVSAPAIEFRRDLSAIGGLSVLLVIVSSLVLGLFFFAVIPGLGFPLAVALGAILSPTDAVATTIVRRLGAPGRVVTVLEGESLLNDATALVILRTAIVAAASGFSLLTTLGSFAWSVLCALVVGALAGALALRLRSWTTSATANTALGFTIPYLAYVPTEALGGSGLVAAVVAGVVCGQGAVRWLTPEQRVSDKLNWRTVEFILEGAVFLTMGLELFGIVRDNHVAVGGVGTGLIVAAGAFAILVIIRCLYVVPMLALHAARVKRRVRSRLAERPSPRRAARRTRDDRTQRFRADIDYFDASPLTWKHNTIIVWAGMRGAVTLAAAQTLPTDTPERPLLVFIAFVVAAGSLLIQGLTLPIVVRLLGVGGDEQGGSPGEEIRAIGADMRGAAEAAVADRRLRRKDKTSFPESAYDGPAGRSLGLFAGHGDATVERLEFELAVVDAMRARLHELGRSGRHSTAALRYVLDELDAQEIGIKLHLESEK